MTEAGPSLPDRGTPDRDKSVTVAPDGTGDYTSISTAVNEAHPQARIVVLPGTYRETVMLDRAVEIVGDGPVRAIVLVGPGDAGLYSTATGSIVRGLTIRSAAPAGGGVGGFLKRLASSIPTKQAGPMGTADAITISAGDLLLDGCVVDASLGSGIGIFGAGSHPTLRSVDVSGAKAGGIWMMDGTSAQIDGCVIHDCAGPGIVVSGQGSRPSITRNKFTGGAGNGITVFDGASPVIEGNEFGSYPLPIIVATGHGTSPEIRGNVLAGGDDAGITVDEGAGGLIEDNTLSAHTDEIQIGGAGTCPIVKGNRLLDGNGVGILVVASATPTIEGNRIDRMARAGLLVEGPAEPLVRSNDINRTGGPGIMVRGGAAGAFEGNQVSDCLMPGIWLSNAGTSPQFRENVLRDNGGIAGIFIRDGATPTFIGNTVSGQVPVIAREGAQDPFGGVGVGAATPPLPELAPGQSRPAITAIVGVGRLPLAIAADDNDVWVANSGDGCISRIDPSTGRVAANVDLPSPPGRSDLEVGPVAIVLEPASIWVGCIVVDREEHTTGLVARLDRATKSVVWTLQIDGTPMALMNAFGSLWVAESDTGNVLRINPGSRSIEASIRVGEAPNSMASAGGAVWVANADSGHVVRIDPVTNSVKQRVGLGRVAQIRSVDDSLWVTCPNKDVGRWDDGENDLVRLDPNTGTIIARIPTHRASLAIASSPQGLWIAPVGGVARIDMTTNRIVESIDVAGVAFAAAAGPDAVWVLYQYAQGFSSEEGMPGVLIKVNV